MFITLANALRTLQAAAGMSSERQEALTTYKHDVIDDRFLGTSFYKEQYPSFKSADI